MIYFTGCLHLGHKNIHTFRPFVSSCEENTHLIMDDLHATLKKRDITYFLGDIAFDDESIDLIKGLPGRKILVKGNHDDYVKTCKQAEAFEEIYGIFKYKKFWLTHCPIHPDELRGKVNIHAHVHAATIPDPRYINVCPDVLYPKTKRFTLTLDEAKERLP